MQVSLIEDKFKFDSRLFSNEMVNILLVNICKFYASVEAIFINTTCQKVGQSFNVAVNQNEVSNENRPVHVGSQSHTCQPQETTAVAFNILIL